MASTLTLCANPALDITVLVGSILAPGQVHRAKRKLITCGGKANNVALAIHKCLHRTVTASGVVGGAAGSKVVELLEKDGVTCSFSEVSTETRSTYVLVSDKDGQTVINENGPEVTAAEASTFYSDFVRLCPSHAAVVIAGSMAPGLPPDFFARIVDHVLRSDGSSICRHVFLDFHSAPLLEVAQLLRESPAQQRAARVYVKINLDEFVSTWKESAALDLVRWAPAYDRLLDAPCRVASDLALDGLLVTNGAHAAICIFPNNSPSKGAAEYEAWRLAPPPIDLVNATASGDCASAGIVSRLVEGASWLDACQFGMGCGSANAEMFEPCAFTEERAHHLSTQVVATSVE